MTVAKMSKEELEELQSAETWEGTGETVRLSPKSARAIVYVVFSRDDFEIVGVYSRLHGMK